MCSNTCYDRDMSDKYQAWLLVLTAVIELQLLAVCVMRAVKPFVGRQWQSCWDSVKPIKTNESITSESVQFIICLFSSYVRHKISWLSLCTEQIPMCIICIHWSNLSNRFSNEDILSDKILNEDEFCTKYMHKSSNGH